MIINNGTPVNGKSSGRFQGMDLIKPLYVGGVPDFSTVHKGSGFTTGFKGCISRLMVQYKLSELMREAKEKVIEKDLKYLFM